MQKDSRSPAEALHALADWCAAHTVTRDEIHSIGIRRLCSEAHITPQAAVRIYGDCTNWTHQGTDSTGDPHYRYEDGDVELVCLLDKDESRQLGKLFPVKDQ